MSVNCRDNTRELSNPSTDRFLGNFIRGNRFKIASGLKKMIKFFQSSWYREHFLIDYDFLVDCNKDFMDVREYILENYDIKITRPEEGLTMTLSKSDTPTLIVMYPNLIMKEDCKTFLKKDVFFRIDYRAMYYDKIIHGKLGKNKVVYSYKGTRYIVSYEGERNIGIKATICQGWDMGTCDKGVIEGKDIDDVICNVKKLIVTITNSTEKKENTK